MPQKVRLQACLAAALVALAFAVFWPVFEHAFVEYDDLVYLAYVRDGLSWETATRAFTTSYFSNWIPLTTLTLLADTSLYGKDPAGFLLTNVALHAAASALLFAALVALTGATWRSLIVAAIFAIHPLHVEPVAWMSQRKDVLSALFFAATLLAYARYARRPSLWRGLGVATLTGLGLLAKPVLMTLPGVLLLLDFWPLGRLGAEGRLLDRNRVMRAVAEKLPLFALAISAAAVAYLVQRSSGAMSHGVDLPLGLRAANAVVAYVAYLGDAFWPTGLAAFYPYPVQGIPPLVSAASGGALLALTAGALASARRHPYLAVGWLWYVGMLAPVSGLVQVGMQARADRYTYLPLIGLAIAVTWGVARLVEQRPRLRPAVAVGAALAIAALAVAAQGQVAHWRDSRSLFERALAVTEDNYFAHHGLGRELAEQGHLEEAGGHFEEAIRLRPAWLRPLIERAGIHAQRGEFDLAIEGYERVLALDPGELRARINLGQLLLRAGRSAEARRELESVHAAIADGARLSRVFRLSLHRALARARAQEGDLAGAALELEAWAALDPEDFEVHERLGLALLRSGRVEQARAALERARTLGGDSAELHEGLALVAGAEGDAAGAVRHYRAALERDPENLGAANNLAWIYATHPAASLRDPDAALALAESAAARTGRRDPVVIDTLAAAYAAQGRFEEAAARARRAARIADEAGNPQLAAKIRARESLYRSGREYVAGEIATPAAP